jgi:hypothetical protein
VRNENLEKYGFRFCRTILSPKARKMHEGMDFTARNSHLCHRNRLKKADNTFRDLEITS